jgi:hypothetical protein
MDVWAKGKRPWPEFYDTQALLNGADLSNGRPFVVDVGGHHGIDLMRMAEKHPDLPAGSLVLEDLPEVVSAVTLTTDKIRPVAHDLFKEGVEQPIKGRTPGLLLVQVSRRLTEMCRSSSVFYACRPA